METGIKYTIEKTVTTEMTARIMGSGTLDVLATPSMIALIEETAWKSVASELEPGMASVGTNLKIDHLAPTPVGMKVRCETELKEVDGRKLIFEVNVYDEKGLVGKGTHERFIINEEKFLAKANSKLNKEQ